MPDKKQACSIKVAVEPKYLPEHSDPEQNHFVFAYYINIHNAGQIAAQLISRHWLIVDANDNVQEVRGLGVVGCQPLLEPGAHFEYSSSCVLTTPVGVMRGSYQMVTMDGSQFEATIAEFTLAMPHVLH